MIKAVFFDAGGTLVHPLPSLTDVYCDVTRGLGVELDQQSMTDILSHLWDSYQTGRGEEEGFIPDSDERDEEFWRVYTQRIYDEVPALQAVGFADWFSAIHGAFASSHRWCLFPEANEVLTGLASRGIKLGIVSNWGSSLLPICDDLGLSNRMDFVLASALVGCRKPCPDIFHRALELASVSPDEALHVGDTHLDDVIGAERAGIRPVFIERGAFSKTPTQEVSKDLRILLSMVSGE